jgi:hypothetical protein
MNRYLKIITAFLIIALSLTALQITSYYSHRSTAQGLPNCTKSTCYIGKIGFVNSKGMIVHHLEAGVQYAPFFLVKNTASYTVVAGADIEVCSGSSPCAFRCACAGFGISANGFYMWPQLSESFSPGTYTLTVYLTPDQYNNTILSSQSLTFTVT